LTNAITFHDYINYIRPKFTVRFLAPGGQESSGRSLRLTEDGWYLGRNGGFRDCPSQLGWDACMQCHPMQRTNTTLVGSECTDVHRVAKSQVPCNDANRAAHAPTINHKITIATTLGLTGINKQTMRASIRRAASTHGYRTPHHLTSWAQVHMC
jgi:hypothetical protein